MGDVIASSVDLSVSSIENDGFAMVSGSETKATMLPPLPDGVCFCADIRLCVVLTHHATFHYPNLRLVAASLFFLLTPSDICLLRISDTTSRLGSLKRRDRQTCGRMGNPQESNGNVTFALRGPSSPSLSLNMHSFPIRSAGIFGRWFQS